MTDVRKGSSVVFADIDSLAVGDAMGGEPLVVLVASSAVPGEDVAELGRALAEGGCAEVCCVGRMAEEWHDAIDSVFESRSITEVVTSWFQNPDEGVEYFFETAAGGGPRTLLVIAPGTEAGLLRAMWAQRLPGRR